MLSIGEMSRVTRITVKALRLYHRKGLLVPDSVAYRSRYRYYSPRAVEKALIIHKLKELGFSLEEIKGMVRGKDDDQQIAADVEKKLAEINRTIQRYDDIKRNLQLFLESIHDAEVSRRLHVEREIVPDLNICGLRFSGRYQEVGAKITQLYKTWGRYARGRPFSLYYDNEFKEEAADIEAAFAVPPGEIKAVAGATRLLKGGPAVSLLHYGPYEELSRSYQRLFEFCRENGLAPELPIREQYIKGPGIIFRGNPQRYVTKLLVLVKAKKTALTPARRRRGRRRPNRSVRR